MLQRTVFINKIRIIQRTRKNTIGRRSTRDVSSLPALIRVSFILFVIDCKVQLSAYLHGAYKLNKLILYYFYIYFWVCIIFFLFKLLCWMVTLL